LLYPFHWNKLLRRKRGKYGEKGYGGERKKGESGKGEGRKNEEEKIVKRRKMERVKGERAEVGRWRGEKKRKKRNVPNHPSTLGINMS